MEDDQYVIRGPEPYETLSKKTLGMLFWKIMIDTKPCHTIMIDAHTGQKISNRQLLEEACNLAEALRHYGCSTNTTVALCSENNLQFFTPVLASLFAGTILVPLNYNYTPEELEHTLHITEPKIVFCSKKSYRKFLTLKDKMKFIDRIIVIDVSQSILGVDTLGQFVDEALRGKSVLPINFSPFDGDPKHHASIILCSSGTTGLPKGVMLSHFNVATRMLQSRSTIFIQPRRGSWANAVFHAYGLIFGLSSIFNRHLTIMIDRFNEDFFLKTIQDYRISVVRITPPLAIFLAKSPKVFEYDLSSIADVFCAAAPLSGETELELKKRLKIKTIHQAYGCTEGTLALTFMRKDVYRSGSCGQVITYMICKVRDPETGRSLPSYKVGELCFKGPTVMMGYYKNEAATRESFTTDGWLRTGDLGYYDNEQYFYIVDRLKEVIKYNGYQVAPAELEAILVNHPKVLDAGVIGLPDERSGELPVAFVVKQLGTDVTETELQKYVSGKVSPQKRLRGGVIFVSSIPKNSSGKILRKQLKQELLDRTKPQKSKL